MPTYYVAKTTDTYADVLVTWGLSRVLADVLLQAGIPGDIWLEDGGTHFVVRLPQAFERGWLERIHPKRFTFYLVKQKETYKKSYEGTKVIFLDEQYERAKSGRAEANSIEARNVQIENAAHQFLGHFGAMASLSADDVVNAIFEMQPVEEQAYSSLIGILLQLFSVQGMPPTQLVKALKAAGLPTATVTTGAMLNPTQGKGDNRAKPAGAKPGNMNALWVWEWLKIIGFHESAITANFKDSQGKVREYRIAVLVPKRISLLTHHRVYEEFLKAYYSGSGLKMDCLAGLNYAEAFLSRLQEKSILSDSILEEAATLRDVMQGFQAASFFKNSQHTFAVSRVTNYDLPAWVMLPDTHDQAQMERYKNVVQEHRKCVRLLDEERGEQVTMLERYRDWISSGSLAACFDFFACYAEHRMKCAAEKKLCPAFSTTNLEVIFMNDTHHGKPLRPIIENEGFRNIATAIRKGTINAQFRKKSESGLPSGMEIHYELSHDLKRNASYRDKFVAALCDYLNTYNIENARVRDRLTTHEQALLKAVRAGKIPDETDKQVLGKLRKDVLTEDIDQVVGLIDDYDSALICGLLLAYGYAREPYDPDTSGEDTTPENAANTEGETASE